MSCYLDPTSLFIHCEGHFVDAVTNGVAFYPVITILSALRGHALDNSRFQEVDLEPFSVTIGSHTPRVDTVQATIPGGITGIVISRSGQTTRWDSFVFYAQRHNTAIWISKQRKGKKRSGQRKFFVFTHAIGGHWKEKFHEQEEFNPQRICLRDNMAAISLYATVTSFIVRHRDVVTRRLLKHCKHCPFTKILTLLPPCVGVTKCFSIINHSQNAIQQVANYVIMWQALQRLYNIGWISYSWFSLLWWDGHVVLQNNGKISLFVGFFEKHFHERETYLRRLKTVFHGLFRWVEHGSVFSSWKLLQKRSYWKLQHMKPTAPIELTLKPPVQKGLEYLTKALHPCIEKL